MGILGFSVILIYLLLALFAPQFSTFDPKESQRGFVLVPPSDKFLIGTDNVGRDIFSQLIYGSRVSIMIGILAAAISAIIGSIIGLLSGYYGGRIDEILMRIVDAIMVLPRLAIMIVLAAILGPSVWNIILVIGVLGWVYTARVVRAQVLSVKERPFVEAARCIGASNLSIMFGEILPNVFPIIFVQTTLGIGWAIYSEATLSFLGLGDPTVITWGQMLHFCWQSGVMSYAWWWAIPPGLTITFLILGFSFLGSGLNEVLNPRYRLR